MVISHWQGQKCEELLPTSQQQDYELVPAFQETLKIRYQAKRSAIGLAWMFLKDNKIVGRSGGTFGARTEAFINLDTKNQVVVCSDGNGGTFPVAIDLVR
jgi:hypothetical protein